MKIDFDSFQDYENFIKEESVEVMKAVSDSIKEAVTYNQESALLFELYFKGGKYAYELTLDRDQWETTLDKCIEVFTKHREPDLAIDTYYLKEMVRELFPESEKKN